MKKLYSLTALGALFYTMPASASLLDPSISYYLPTGTNPTVFFMFIILISISIQALLFRYFVKNTTYFEGMFLATLSHVACYSWNLWPSTFTMLHVYNNVFNAILTALENLIASFSSNLWIALAIETLALAIINSIIMIIAIIISKGISSLQRKPSFEFPSIRETWAPIVLGNIITYALLFILKISIGS